MELSWPEGVGDVLKLGPHLTSDMIDPISAGGQQLGQLPDLPQLQAAAIQEFSAGDTSTANTTEQQGRTAEGNNQLPSLSTADLLPVTPTTQLVLQQQQGVSTTAISPSQNISASTGQPGIMSPVLFGGGLISALNSPTNDTPSLVSIGQSLPLLPRKLIQQIKAGEYIDFSDLPPAKGRQLTPTNYNSQLVLVQLQEVERQRKLIPDFLTWSQCFAIYTAVLGADQPHRLPELMAYQIEIARCAKKYKWPSWIIYDINFRQAAAGRSGLSWATVESSIYTQCFTCMAKDPSDVWCRNCQSLDHGTATCPIMPQSKIPRRERLIPEPKREAGGEAKKDTICRNYNTKGCSYPHCPRRHVCWNCHEKHPLSKCKDTSQAKMRPSLGGGTSST